MTIIKFIKIYFDYNNSQLLAKQVCRVKKDKHFYGHALAVPAPDSLCAIGTKHRKVECGRWQLYTPRHKPHDTLQGHLTFALKYEGIDLVNDFIKNYINMPDKLADLLIRSLN